MPPLRARRRPLRAAIAVLAVVLAAGGCAPAAVSPAPSATSLGGAAPTQPRSAAASSPATPSPAASVACLPVVAADLPWWNDRVFYEVFVRSFQDSDGDGIGDLRGLTDRLDYLNDGDPTTTGDLGVTGIWLMPVAESPSYHGYDVVDYRAVERDYGTADDFRAFIDAAHERGIAVIVDLVLNHTSIEHPWFAAARDGSGREDWYLWADERPRGVVKPGGDRVWHPLGDRFYYGYFWQGMPDLNLANRDVTAELDAAARFWLEEMGVDGFRLDAIKHLFEDGAELEDVPESRVWLEGFQDRLEQIDPDVLLVGEAYDVTRSAAAYVPESVDISFDFGFAAATLLGAGSGQASPVASALEESLTAYPPGQRGVFLTNHDQPRVMTELAGEVGAGKAAATVLLTSPGVPFVYYGEEIGMRGTKPDERIRTPMAWDASPTGGFTSGSPWQSPADGGDTANVAVQVADDASLLAHYRELIRLRRDHPALSGADTVVLETSDDAILAVGRRTADETIAVIVNLSDEAVPEPTVELAPLACNPATSAEVLLGDGPVETPSGGSWTPVSMLDAHASLVVRLGGRAGRISP